MPQLPIKQGPIKQIMNTGSIKILNHMKNSTITAVTILLLGISSLYAQGTTTTANNNTITTPNPDDVDTKKDLRFNFNKSGTHYVKFTITNQVWLRFNESNPGTIVNSLDKPYTFDIGLRRLRFQIIGQVHEKFLVYVQFGINNFTPMSPRKMGDFFHDAVVEYTPVNIKNKNKPGITNFSLSLGTGITAWTGFSRFSAPGVASFLGIDAPLYQQSTNDATDQFLRKFSVYVKGKAWKFDYRFVLSDPFTITTSTFFDPNISQYANFTPIGRSVQPSGYVSLQLFDQEDNQLPYNIGTYLGKKKVLNFGAGFQYQPHAMWYTRTGTDTTFADMYQLGADIFYDTYLGKNKDWAFSIYGCYNYYNFGPGYLRQLGVMNPGQSVAAGTPTVNGTGNAFPMIGTGHVGYMQTGVVLPKKWFNKKEGNFTIMPYFCAQVAKWDRLNDIMATFDTGLNFMFDGHKYKMTINYQNRPVFTNTDFTVLERRSMVNFQFQIAI